MRHQFAAVLLLVLCLVYGTFACSCLTTPSRNKFCDADFVILARVLRTSIDDTSLINGKTYTLEVVVSFKGTNKPGSVRWVNTAVHGATCGVYLDDGKFYLLAGYNDNDDSMKINLCGWNILWKDLKHIERIRLWNKSYNCRNFQRPLPIRGAIEEMPFPDTVLKHQTRPRDVTLPLTISIHQKYPMDMAKSPSTVTGFRNELFDTATFPHTALRLRKRPIEEIRHKPTVHRVRQNDRRFPMADPSIQTTNRINSRWFQQQHVTNFV